MADLTDGGLPEDCDGYDTDDFDEALHEEHGDLYLFSCGTPSYEDIINRHKKEQQEQQQHEEPKPHNDV